MLLFDTDTSSASVRYETLTRIGRGGMAEVLLAATRSNGVVKLSVLKCLWPEMAEDGDFVEMFLDEARLSARLSHPNVVQTHGVVQHEGRLAISMEYLEGQPLTSVLGRLSSSPELTLATRLRVVTSVLAGLEYAHGLTDFDGTPLEVVHRDVSPHNVIVTYDGHVKLLDFGVAKTLAAIHQTRPGGIKGKLAYLAPEAIRGDGVDRRADVFSAGIMLWEIVAGRRLWGRRSEGVSGAWRLASGEHAPELPLELDLPPRLREICARALALDPAERHQTAAALAADLETIGVDASDADARRLGRLVSDAFAGEREQRRALVEFHVRPAPSAAPGATPDYECVEVSLLGATSVHERPDTEAQPSTAAATESAPLPVTFAAPPARRRGARVARALLATTAIAAVALVSGVYVGRRADRWPLFAMWAPPAAPRATTQPGSGTSPAAAMPPVAAASPFSAASPVTAAPPGTAAQPAFAPPAPAPTTALIVPLPDPHEAHASATHEHRDHRGEGRSRRARALDLLSDEVLDLDGEPLASSTGSAGTRVLHN